MTEIRTWFRNVVVPRMVFLPYYLTRAALVGVSLVRRLKGKRWQTAPTALCIEAGARGWDSIEFKELHASASEYLGRDFVHKVIIVPDVSYFAQVRAAVDATKPTHYVYDARTGAQKPFVGLWQSFRLSCFMHFRGITPIVLLTDISLRHHRAQSAIVSAKSGVVVSFLSARLARPFFPHDRLVAPSLMPFSVGTINTLARLREQSSSSPPKQALFVGSLYEPRTSILKDIAGRLEERGLMLEIRGRRAGDSRIPDEAYWSMLVNSPIVLTTAEQVVTPLSDWTWITQLTYRYLEAMAAGTLLIAPAVPGVRRFFAPGEHFVAFKSTAEAADAIEYYLRNDVERRSIAQRGQTRAEALIRARSFWTGVDVGLGPRSLT